MHKLLYGAYRQVKARLDLAVTDLLIDIHAKDRRDCRIAHPAASTAPAGASGIVEEIVRLRRPRW